MSVWTVRHVLLFSIVLHEMILRTCILNDNWCHAGGTSWTLYHRITALGAQTLAWSIVCGILLYDRVYVLMLKQVCQCLPGAVHFPPPLAFTVKNIYEGKCCIVCYFSPHPTPTPCTHTYTRMCRVLSQLWQCTVYGVLIGCTSRGSSNACHSHVPWLVWHS